MATEEPDEARQEVWAIQPCLYGGKRRERGERFLLAGLPTDRRLLEELYVQRIQPRHRRYDCGRCGKRFVGGENFSVHLVHSHGLPREAARREAEGGEGTD